MFTVLTFFILFIHILLIFLVLTRNRSSITTFLLATFIFLLSLWVMTNYLMTTSKTALEMSFWLRSMVCVTTPLPTIFFLLSCVFPNIHTNIPWKIFSISLFSATCVSLLAFSPYLFETYPTFGPAFFLYILHFFIFTVLGLIVLTTRYKKAKGVVHQQLYYFLIGVALTLLSFFVTNYVLVMVSHNIHFAHFNPFFSLFIVSFLTVALIRHRFLDMKLVLVRTVSYSALLALLAFCYSFGIFWLERFFIPKAFTKDLDDLFTVVLIFIISVSFQPLRDFFNAVTERLFYRRIYDSEVLLQELCESFTRTLVLDKLCSSTIRKIFLHLKISSATIIIKNKKNHFLTKRLGKITLSGKSSEDLFTLLKIFFSEHSEHILLTDELQENLLKNTLEKRNIFFVLPFFVQERLIGVLLLGDRASGDYYSSVDIKFLKVLAPQFAVAVRNALSYQEIKLFTATLKEEVSRATLKLKKANSRLTQLDKVKNEFVFITSHELRTPMTAIKGYVWMAMKNINTKKHDKVPNYLRVAYSSTERLITLVQHILTLASIESKKTLLQKTGFNVYSVTKNVAEELLIQSDEKQITLHILRPSFACTIFGDAEKIRQVFQNIIGNAIKFTPQNGRITVRFKHVHDLVVIQITDTGPGIKSSAIPYLFQKFHRIEDSYTTTSELGTGLGLYISKKIIKNHNGEIDVSSVVGEGTTFTISLHQMKEANAARNADAPSGRRDTITGAVL